MSYKYFFTVFTPAYNAVKTLHRVHDSLKVQTFRDFEWLVIDDGSKDGTGELVKSWQQEASFPIRYIWKENAGKHMAVNQAVLLAEGEFFLINDHDDACVPTALERFKYHWESIPDDQKPFFTGVTCLVQDPDGKLLGHRFPFDVTDSDSLDIYFRHHVRGEKWGFHRTEVLRQFPYQQVEGERFMGDSLVWYKIALQYKTRFVNEVLGIYFPSPTTVTSRLVRVRAENSKGARLYYKELLNLKYKLPFPYLIRSYANYIRFSLHSGAGMGVQMRDVPSPLVWWLAAPIGAAKYVQDRIHLRRQM